MKVVVYGTGCKSCKKLYQSMLDTIANNDIRAEVIYETSLDTIISKGIMQTPALEVDGRMVSKGKVLKEKEILAFLKQ